MIDLEFDTDVVARSESHTQVRSQPFAFSGIGVIAPYAKIGSGFRERLFPVGTQIRLPLPAGVVEQAHIGAAHFAI
ncbi:hypothetical protein TM48_02763 [Mycobacterium shottsii]|uniref:Uncharacterized protein n=1 Tax=Mycobacterium shottsii TaxID=133549 RepID=A0A7I7LGC0_9MYCO|nr:hypothetical protein TM48_02763 [Mycobacterium shottsii]BBX58399.1 hypothetical protein MSHO_37440 [Mycobacterium shottsii]